MSLSWVEFHAVNPVSDAMVPSSLICSPKKATVESSGNFQLG